MLNGLVGRIAKDEERHEEFFAQPRRAPASTSAATRRSTRSHAAPPSSDVVGADIDAYKDKVQVVADAGIFDEAALRQVISDRITAWGLADEPQLREFVNAVDPVSCTLLGG